MCDTSSDKWFICSHRHMVIYKSTSLVSDMGISALHMTKQSLIGVYFKVKRERTIREPLRAQVLKNPQTV